ncbi:MAG TPA: PKD domain-containing protein, partial [Chitinophagaceae bacterium]|nr:PKD domain-containing protein [Chitinophagaceae bacterium]
MKKNCFPGTLVLLFVLLGNCSFAQDFSNKGKDFWVGYGYHQVMNAGNGQNMVLYFATDQVTNITISIPGTGYTQNITSPAGNNIITSAIIPKAGMQDARLMTEGIQNKGIHITSDKPMVAYAHIYNASVSGSCLLFPTNTLGKEYYSINFKNISNSDPANCWFYVVAVDTGTTSVEITPSANTVGGWQAGNTYTVNLTQGQIYNVMGILTGNSTPCGPNTFTGVDLTGSKIRSISASGVCKRIGVFSGSGRISITSTDCQSSSDNYMVQSFPKSAWGKKYLTTPTEGATNNMGSNYFRICVADPTTVVRVNGAIITGLTNNFYYELSPTKIPNLIEADKPITVAQYITTQGQFNNGSPGDPEMIYLSPVEQTISKVIFNSNLLVATPSSSHQHNVSVVIPNGGTALSSFRLDGATPPVPFTVHPQDPGYSYIKISGLSQGQHIIESDSGFNAIAYGYAQAESYGYNAGTNVKDLFQFISVRNQYATVNFPATCKGSPFYFSMTFPYEPTQIQWVFGAALNTMGIADVTLNNPVFDSSWTVSGKQLYRYKLPTPYTISNSGTYPIRVNATNPTPDGCSGNQEIDFDVQVFDPPTADFNFNTNGCITSPVQFTDNSAGNGRTINNWFWSFGDGNNNTSNNNPTHTYNAAGSYLVKYAIRTDVGCISDTASRTVVLNNAPLAKFGLTTPLCAGKPVTFSDTSTASGSNTLVKWTWNFGEGTPVIATNNASQTHTYSNPGVYTASLQVETSSGCASTVFSRQITINANPVAGFNLPAICMPSGAAQFNDQSTVAGGTI